MKAYRAMEMARAFDTKLSALYKAGKIYGGVFTGRGHEAIAACEGVYLQKGHDVYTPFIREQAGRCAWGDSVLESARSYFGSALGLMRGREGNVHWGNPREGTLAPISHLGAMIPVVAGMLMAKRMQGEKDFQVKADKDFGAYKELLKDRNNVTFKLYENLNHAFVPSVYGDIAKAKQEYNVEQHIGEEVIADIADWIKQL